MAVRRGEVAVVGAGLIGLFSAHYLLERGYAVTLLERGDPGGGASRVNGGWVCPARSDPLPSYPVVRDGIRSLVSRSDGGFFLAPAAIPRVAGFLTRFLGNASPGRFDRAWDELDTLNVRTAPLVDELVATGVIGDLSDEGFLMLHPTRGEAEASRAALVAVAREASVPRRSRSWAERRCSPWSRASGRPRSGASCTAATGGSTRPGSWTRSCGRSSRAAPASSPTRR